MRYALWQSVWKKFKYANWFTNIVVIIFFALFVSSNRNPTIPNIRIPAIFANPESRDWQQLNPGISG